MTVRSKFLLLFSVTNTFAVLSLLLTKEGVDKAAPVLISAGAALGLVFLLGLVVLVRFVVLVERGRKQ